MNLTERHAAIKREAEALAGGMLEIPRRVLLLIDLFRQSGGNHTFPLIAAHGALWAYGYFEAGGSLGRLIAKRYFYNTRERIFRLGLLQRFAEDFRRVNRQVCIDTWTNFHFTAECGGDPGAERWVPAPLLAVLNEIHDARRAGQAMTEPERRRVFQQSFLCEQENTVAPGVKAAVAAFDCRIMQTLCLHPIVRFAYFPACRHLFFRNFGETQERIAKGLRAWDLASAAGWPRVEESLGIYGVMPPEQLLDPGRQLEELRRRMIDDAAALTPPARDAANG